MRLLPATIAVILAASALSGCGPTPGPATTSGAPTPGASATAGSSATPSPTPTVDPNVLFSITAEVTAPNGAVATVVQSVSRPVASLPDQSDVEAQLDAECDGWRTEIGTGSYLVSRIVSTVESGTWPGDLVVVSMNGWPVFSGDYSPFQAYCASAQVVVPGTARAVSPVPAGGAADDPGGWGTINYGLGLAYEAGHPDTAQPGDTVISECTISVTAAGLAESTRAASWATTPQDYPDFGCMVNF